MRRFTDRKTLAALFRSTGLAALVALGAPALAQAQSAIIYGSLSNFDISNDTGQVCHGFEVQVDGMQLSDYGGSFTANRYGTPVVQQTPTGVSVTWGTTYSPSSGWSTRTLQHTVPWFSGQCYSWSNSAIYENGGCEHFGTYFTANPTKVTSRWMCESSADPSVLVPVDPPTATPFPSYYVQPPAVQNNPPQLVVEVQAPEPAEVVGQYGDAQWIRTFVTQLQQPVALDQLVADQPAVVPMDAAQLEADYSIIQDEPPAGGNGNRRRNRNQGNIEPTTRAIVRRIETWAFTGQYDPITHEALCADLLCNAPAVDEIGELIAVQMTAANVQPDALFIAKIGNGTVSSSDKLISCGSKCVQPYNAGALVTLTAKAASGNSFTGWLGACAGANATCTVPVNAATNVTANFAPNPSGGGGNTGGGGGGGGGGATSSTFTLTVSTGNPGTITATPAGTKNISCGKDCSSKFASGAVVTLTATPAAGKAFLGWTDACLAAGTNTTCTVTMTANKTTKATFAK
ncbi:MAG: hypothetical protein ABMA15_01085 [Vicinamibacterales bacterium]